MKVSATRAGEQETARGKTLRTVRVGREEIKLLKDAGERFQIIWEDPIRKTA